MTFDKNGFAGEFGAKLRIEQRATYADIFFFADECSQHALKVIQLTSATRSKRELTVSLFFARCTSHYQAAISLAEGGMTIESLVLSRSLLETVFVLLAIAEDKITPAELASHDYASRMKHANALLNSSSYPNVDPFKEKLGDFVEKGGDSKTIDMHELSRRAEALALYDGLYRHLSHHAAHPSLSAVNPYLADDEKGEHKANYHPILDYTPAAVLSACAGILIASFGCDKTGIRTAKTNSEGTQLWDRYEVLYGRYTPWD